MKKENNIEYVSLMIKSVLLGLGFYYLLRIVRNSFYFPIINPLEEANPPVYQILRYLGHVIFIIGFVLYFHFVKEDGHCLKALNFKPKDILYVALGLIGGFLLNGGNILIAFLHGDIDMVKCSFNVLLIIISFFSVAIQATAEEVHFRLWTHKRIARGAPLIFAFIGSSFTFAWSHMLNNGITFNAVVNIFLHGILYALFLEITGNIWLSSAFHTAWNFTQNFIFGLPNSGYKAILTMMNPTYTKSSICYNPEFGVEATLVGIIINLVLILIVYAIYRKKKLNL